MPVGSTWNNSNNTDYHSNDEEDDNFKIRAKTQQQKEKIYKNDDEKYGWYMINCKVFKWQYCIETDTKPPGRLIQTGRPA